MKEITLISNFVEIIGYTDIKSIFKKITSPDNADFFEELRSDYKKGELGKYKFKKENLIAFVITGKFLIGGRANSLVEYSGMMIIDFDKLGNKLSSVKRVIIDDPHTFACFLSPSGDGLKVIVCIDSKAEDHKEMYEAIQAYYEVLTKAEADAVCKNIGRLCYISYDPDLYVNECCEQFKLCDMVKRIRQMELF